MKIQGPHPFINTYKQSQQQQLTKKSPDQKDQLDISSQAKKMQQHQLYESKRAEYVNDIKHLVQSGEYKVDHEKLAEKMMKAWSKEL